MFTLSTNDVLFPGHLEATIKSATKAAAPHNIKLSLDGLNFDKSWFKN